MNKYIIGLDFSTKYIKIGYWDNKVILLNIYKDEKNSNKFVASLKFNQDNKEIIYGSDDFDSGNIVYDLKRLISCDFFDIFFQKDLTYWNFDVINDNGTPIVNINHGGEMCKYSGYELIVLLFKYIKKRVDTILGHNKNKKTGAYITIPPRYSQNRICDFKSALKEAKFEVLKTFYEPIAACFSYGLPKFDYEQSYLYSIIFDCGSRCLDVSVTRYTCQKSIWSHCFSKSNFELGGDKFTRNLIQYCLKQYKQKNNIPVKHLTHSEYSEFKKICENAKIELSTKSETNIILKINNEETNILITQNEYNAINRKLYSNMLSFIDKVLSENNFLHSYVSSIVLTGGACLNPEIYKILKNKFPLVNIHNNDIEDAVIKGIVTLTKPLYSTKNKLKIKKSIILNNIYTNLSDKPLFKKNDILPCSKKISVDIYDDGDAYIDCYIYKEENSSENIVLSSGSYYVNLNTKKTLCVDIVYSVDENQLLIVTAQIKSRPKTKKTIIQVVLN